MDRRHFLKIGTAVAVSPALAAGKMMAEPTQVGKRFTGRDFKSAPMDLYLIWDDGEGPTDFRVTIRHESGSAGYSFDQCHTPGRHFAGTYHPGDAPEVTGTAAPDSTRPALPFRYEWVPTEKRTVKRVAHETFTAATLNEGDTLEFRLARGKKYAITLVSTESEITRTREVDGSEWITQYRFEAKFTVNGTPLAISRCNPSNEDSFAKPFYFNGMMIWLDAVQKSFEDVGGFLSEKDFNSTGVTCRPKRDARIVVQDASFKPCPGDITAWFRGAERPHEVSACYSGCDTWMGPFCHEGGAMAHGGLDLNTISGTILRCPIDVDDQYLYQSVKAGAPNNRWRGVRTFNDGVRWWIQTHHLNYLLPGIKESTPMAAGTAYADTGGTFTGGIEHTHFCLRVFDGEEDFWLDPWILMRESSPFTGLND